MSQEGASVRDRLLVALLRQDSAHPPTNDELADSIGASIGRTYTVLIELVKEGLATATKVGEQSRAHAHQLTEEGMLAAQEVLSRRPELVAGSLVPPQEPHEILATRIMMALQEAGGKLGVSALHTQLGMLLKGIEPTLAWLVELLLIEKTSNARQRKAVYSLTSLGQMVMAELQTRDELDAYFHRLQEEG